jgi:hypothetical protein
MNRETLQKFYPVIIGLSVVALAASIYFSFFAGGSRNANPEIKLDSPGGFSIYPPKDGSTIVDGKSVPLQTLRDVAASGSGDQKELVKAINALGDARDIHAAPQLLNLLEGKGDADPKRAYVRERAGVAMEKILGSDFHFSAKPGEPDRMMSEPERKKIIESMRKRSELILAKLDK